MITLKSLEEIELMRRANQIVAETLDELVAAAKSGVTSLELDRLAEHLTLEKGAKPAFKGYKPHTVEYRHSLCVSINNEIVHGIPSAKRRLKDGDIVGLDFAASLMPGWREPIFPPYFVVGAMFSGVGRMAKRPMPPDRRGAVWWIGVDIRLRWRGRRTQLSSASRSAGWARCSSRAKTASAAFGAPWS